MADTYRVMIRLSPEIYAQLAARGSSGQPLAAIVRHALVQYLAQQPEQPPSAARAANEQPEQPPHAAPQLIPSPYGRPGIAPETLQAIATERRRYPTRTMKAFAQHLFEQGIYRGRARDGHAVPVDHSRLRRWLQQARQQS